MVTVQGAWFKRILLCLLIRHGCDKLIRLAPLIPFKSQMLLLQICQVVGKNGSRKNVEEMDLIVLKGRASTATAGFHQYSLSVTHYLYCLSIASHGEYDFSCKAECTLDVQPCTLTLTPRGQVWVPNWPHLHVCQFWEETHTLTGRICKLRKVPWLTQDRTWDILSVVSPAPLHCPHSTNKKSLIHHIVIWHLGVLLFIPVCLTSRVYVHCAPVHISLLSW